MFRCLVMSSDLIDAKHVSPCTGACVETTQAPVVHVNSTQITWSYVRQP